MHAEKCPVCGGKGKVNPVQPMETCHGCGGKGWVSVPDEPVGEAPDHSWRTRCPLSPGTLWPTRIIC